MIWTTQNIKSQVEGIESIHEFGDPLGASMGGI